MRATNSPASKIPFRTWTQFLSVATVLTLASGCGAGGDLVIARPANTGGSVGGQNHYGFDGAVDHFNAQQNSGALGETSDSSWNADATAEGNDPYEFQFSGHGQETMRFEVTTGRVLKIRFYADIPDERVGSTGIVPVYSRLSMRIRVGSKVLDSGAISSGLMSAKEQSRLLDFSAGLPITGSASQRQTVTIQLSEALSDTVCIIQSYCSPVMLNVHALHQFKGSIRVQTDDTAAL